MRQKQPLLNLLVWSFCLGACLVISLCVVDVHRVLAAQPTSAALRKPPLSVQIEVVNTDRLNVRSGPGSIYHLVGWLGQGERIPVLERQGEWARIFFNTGPDGYGWVNELFLSSYTALPKTGSLTSPAGQSATTSLHVGTPNLLAFDGVTFSWQWGDAEAMRENHWYFDLQLFHDHTTDPYDVIMIEPEQVQLVDHIYRFMTSLDTPCNTYWAVQIALRSNHRFAGWVSPRSQRVPLGPNCSNVSTPG